jgi:hypothetical protein
MDVDMVLVMWMLAASILCAAITAEKQFLLTEGGSVVLLDN